MDIHQIKTLHIGAIKLLVQAMQTCRDLGMQFALVAASDYRGMPVLRRHAGLEILRETG